MINCYSADGKKLTTDMVVWVNNEVAGWPPEKKIVGELVNEYKFLYRDEDFGCRASACWVDPVAAMSYAILASKVGIAGIKRC